MEKIIQKIQEQIGAGIYPGASLALYQKGSWQEYYLGLADPDKQEPVIPGLTYDLAILLGWILSSPDEMTWMLRA